MEAITAYYDGQVFVPLAPITVAKNQLARVTLLTDEGRETVSNSTQQREIFSEFFAAIKADNTDLPAAFDDCVAEGIIFREYDWL
jgi:hypothetical protein